MKKNVLYYTVLALWIGFIIGQSCLPPGESKAQSDFVTKIFYALGLTGENLNVIVRKLAHLFEFFVLGGILVTYFPVMKRKVLMIYPAFFALLVAVTDEFVQLFTGRGSLVQDVVLDFAGAVTAVLILGFIFKRRKIQ